MRLVRGKLTWRSCCRGVPPWAPLFCLRGSRLETKEWPRRATPTACSSSPGETIISAFLLILTHQVPHNAAVQFSDSPALQLTSSTWLRLQLHLAAVRYIASSRFAKTAVC